MQSSPIQGLVLNRRHPDAKGCFLAVPVMERGGEVVRNLAGGKGMGQMTWTGTRAYANMRNGRAVNVSQGNYLNAVNVTSPWTNAFTIMCRINATAITNLTAAVRCGNMVIGFNGVGFTLWDEARLLSSQSAQTFAVNVEYAVGVRWRNSDNVPTFFINGAKDVGAAIALTAAAQITGIGYTVGNVGLIGTVRDVRIWDRELPDASFSRYVRDPHTFYTRGTSPLAQLRAAGFKGGRFLPFLHPQWAA